MAKKVTKSSETPKTKSYLIDAMYKPIVEARKLGNRKAIDSKFACENGCSEEHYNAYIQQVLALHKAASLFSFANHMTDLQIVEAGGLDAWAKMKKPLRENIFKYWKMLLEYSEEEIGNKLHCNPDDVCSVIGFVEMFMDDKNVPVLQLKKGSKNAKAKEFLRAYEEMDMPTKKIEAAKIAANAEIYSDFASEISVEIPKKVLATKTFAKFRKDVETLLGIRFAGSAMLTIGQRNYLLEEKRLINRINNARDEISRRKSEINRLENFKKFIEDKQTLENVEGEIKKMQDEINGVLPDGKSNLEKKIKDGLDALEKLHKNGIDNEATDWSNLKD